MPTDMEVRIIDRAAIINMIKPTTVQRTSSDYAYGSFLPYIEAQLSRFYWHRYYMG